MTPVVNTADALYFGDELVDRVYLGEERIWPGGFSPPDLTGLKVWLDASQLGLADGVAVSPWPNLGSGPSGAMVGTPAPKMSTVKLNGLSVVLFTASEGRLRMTGTGVHLSWTTAYVGRIVPAFANRLVGAIYPTGGNLPFGFHGSRWDVMYDNGWALPDVGVSAGTTWKLYSGDGVGSTSRLFSNGTLLSTATTAAGWGNTFAISGYDPTGVTETSTCEVAEVVQYDRKLSDPERVQVEDYLRAKWGL